MKSVCILILSILFCNISDLVCASGLPESNTLRLKIIDSRQEAIFGVYVINKNHSYLITSTDIDGECTINTETMKATDSIQFQGMGYEVVCFCLKDLFSRTTIILKELEYDLDEVKVIAVNTDKILAEATAQLKKSFIGGTPLCRYYGNVQYEKLTECRNMTVEYRREYGHFFTSGDLNSKDIWDSKFRSYIVPAYMARSYNLTCGGTDTLTPIFMTTEDVRFDVGTRKILTLMRAIQLYAPIFDGTKQYLIQRIPSDSSDYVFSFKTSPFNYPADTRISCKGTFSIDTEHHRLKHISFEYIDYQLFRQIVLTNKRKTSSPFATKAELSIDYTPDGQYYIRSCTQETSWKYNLGDDFILVEQPSRIYPGNNQLIEKEAFYCANYKPVPEDLQTSRLMAKIHLAQRYPAGVYDSTLFSCLKPLINNKKAIHELNEFMPLEKQFRFHNEKPYYPDNYMSGFRGWKASNTIYKENLNAVRKQIFERFPFTPSF